MSFDKKTKKFLLTLVCGCDSVYLLFILTKKHLYLGVFEIVSLFWFVCANSVLKKL